MASDSNKPDERLQGTEGLLQSLRKLIQEAGQKVKRAVDAVQVQTCWEIGRQIVEFEQRGSARAGYGVRLLPILAEFSRPGVRTEFRCFQPAADAPVLPGLSNSRRDA